MQDGKTIKAEETNSRGYPIAAVSREVNLSQKTIRDYEKSGLIRPRRADRTRNRIFSQFEIDQIKRITYLIHNEGFTLSCLRRLFQLAPCWNIFDCEVKEQCPAYQFPRVPCYETRQQSGTLCGDLCDQCGIYINRNPRKERVLRSPYPEEDQSARSPAP